jgi:hypothetical protein
MKSKCSLHSIAISRDVFVRMGGLMRRCGCVCRWGSLNM